MRWVRLLVGLAALSGAIIPAAARGQGAAATGGRVTGKVTATTGAEPVPGAAVTVVGSRIGAITGPDGQYTIVNVPAGTHVVRAQRIGFSPDSQSVTVAEGQTVTANLTLGAVATKLTEVVSIGYGTATRKELTGAVSSVSSEEITRQPVPSVDQALIGRAPGVQVTTQSGQPGAGSAVRIRGGNSITAGNQPLYVVDGVPMTTDLNQAGAGALAGSSGDNTSGTNPLATLNPADIESIDVLKDASATAIYGARAANGVILITTKRGRGGQNTVSFNTYYGLQDVRRKLPLLNARQWAEFTNEARANADPPQPPVYTPEELAAFGEGTDWQDEIFRQAPVASFNASVSGGDEDTKYFVSGDVLQNDGIVIGTDFDRKSFRLNLDQSVSKRFRVGNSFTVSRSDSRIAPNEGGGAGAASVVLNALEAPPTLPVKNEAGEFFIDPNPATGRPFNNPVGDALEITNKEQQTRVIGNGFAEYDLIPGLSLRSTVGVDYLNSLQNFYAPTTTVPGQGTNGLGSRAQAQTTSWLNENTLHYNHRFADVHSFDLVGGVTFQRTNTDRVGGSAQQFLTDRLRENALQTGGVLRTFTATPHYSLLSYLARANYGFRDRYLFTLTGRVDGSSRFGEENRYAVFPSAAFAWRASDEDFVKNLGVFDDLKFRVSYGRTGNQDIGNYQSLATLGDVSYAFGENRAVGFVPTNIANPDLKWETTDQFDGGVDIGLLKNRLLITADYYAKKTKDLLLQVSLPHTSGFSSSLQNIGSVRNRGFELGINTINLTGALGWDTQINFAWNRNKVLSLGQTNEIINPAGTGGGANQNPTILREGEPVNSFYGWIFTGQMQDGEPVYRDINGDGNVDAADRVIIGNAQPNYTGGMTNRFTFKNLELSVFLQWSVGNKIYNITRTNLTEAGGDVNQLRELLHAGQDGIPLPRLDRTFDTDPSTLFLEDGTYLRGKNIRLGYTLPTQWLERLPAVRFKTLQVYVSAQNFFTVTDYTGFDPEISEYVGSNLAQGIDFGTYPQTKQITFGLSAGL
jgi:TonB-dependent starch-binding outer membrane protein SusC